MRLTLLFLAALLASCSSFGVYRMEITQGNYITQEKVAQLSPGMTRSQVKSILGTPLVSDMFHDNRWDYVFRSDDRKGEIQERKVTVYFDGDSLTKVEGEGFPKDARTISKPDEPGFFSKLLKDIP